ncbi:MAG: GNAT family N-acetyltransferase [Chloroflexi bacterium]|nr:GNAT family N-acetyltransferase [Chloroflexota bacterium]
MTDNNKTEFSPTSEPEIQPRTTLQKGAIVLRAPRPTDLQERLNYHKYPEIYRMYGVSLQQEEPVTPEAALEWYRWISRESLRWIIEADGKLAGVAGLHSLNKEDRRARFAIGLNHPDLLGRGIGTTATRLVLRHAFEEMGLHRVDLRVLAYNKRAIASYRKCGFVQEGVERDSALVNGKWEDDLMMSILEDEYRGLAKSWQTEVE